MEIWILSLIHLMVDALCICCLYLYAGHGDSQHIVEVFFTYTICAFLSQPATGIIADKMRKGNMMMIVAVALFATAIATTAVTEATEMAGAAGFAIASILGIGNSFFHVWGGKIVAIASSNDARSIGFFVSTGALGLALGNVYYSWWMACALLVAICAVTAVFTMCNMDRKASIAAAYQKNNSARLPQPLLWLSMFGLMCIVAARSFAGSSITFAEEKTEFAILLAGAISMAGKIAGGLMLKHLGTTNTAISIAVMVAASMLLTSTWHVAAYVSLFFVNCIMPFTLYFANKLLKDREGLAFGLLAASLLPGYLLVMWQRL